MSFVPVMFDAVNCTIFKANGSNAFELAPTPHTERFTEAGNLTYSAADGNRFDLFNIADNLEVFIHPLTFAASLLADSLQ